MHDFRPPRSRCRPSRRTVLAAMAIALAVPVPSVTHAARPRLAATARVIGYQSGAGAGAEPVAVEVLLRGKGPLVVLLPSLGRSASDFDDLAARIAAAGFQAAAINPRGIGASKGPAARTLGDYARDVAEVIKALAPAGQRSTPPAVLIGHAYGNRLARAVAAQYPEAVGSLILLASGGQTAMAPAVARALFDVFDPTLPPAAHMAAVRAAFFAPGNDPAVWREGWYPRVAMQQQQAIKNSPPESWSDGGRAPIYIIQAAEDAVAPPANAEALRAAHPDRVEIAVLRHAGHAMLPEQPEALARLVLARLGHGPMR